jgi:hypothetical protein
MAVDIIYGEQVIHGVDAQEKGSALWLKPVDLDRVSGWTHRAEGFCRGDVCIPVPAALKDSVIEGDRFNLVALAGLLGRPVVADVEHHVWCVGAAAADRKRTLTSLEAPNFTLPDLDGNMHSLADYRGKKVMVVSWASW